MAGGMIPIDQQVHRIKVVTAFLRAGILLNRMDSFRESLEENITRLAGRRSLSDLIPFIHGEVVGRMKHEIAGQNAGKQHLNSVLYRLYKHEGMWGWAHAYNGSTHRWCRLHLLSTF